MEKYLAKERLRKYIEDVVQRGDQGALYRFTLDSYSGEYIKIVLKKNIFTSCPSQTKLS